MLILLIIAIPLSIFLVVVLLGMMRPRITSLQRSIVINAPAGRVFPHVAELRRFAAWTGRTTKDPNMGETFSGEDGTVGASYYWNGNNRVGSGMVTITAIEPEKMVTMNMDSGAHGKAITSFLLTPENGQTKVTWTFEAEMGPAFRRALMASSTNKLVTEDYEQGLKNLKEKIEG